MANSEVNPSLKKCFLVWIKQTYYYPFHYYSWADKEISSLCEGQPKKWERRAYRYFLEESNLFRIFIRQEYPLTHEIWKTEPNEILERFNKWFIEKREKVMEDTALKMAKQNKKIFKPTSHSGIASLLHVLTRTMEKQGADIRSIAKVQYAVCVQAGVYIPEEFLLDVAISLDIEKDAQVVVDEQGK